MKEIKTRKNKDNKRKYYKKEKASKQKATQRDLEEFMEKFNEKNHKD